MENYIIRTVRELNDEIVDVKGYDSDLFYYIKTDGYNNTVTIFNQCLWADYEDEREWIKEDNIYEPLKPYLKKKARELANKLILITQ